MQGLIVYPERTEKALTLLFSHYTAVIRGFMHMKEGQISLRNNMPASESVVWTLEECPFSCIMFGTWAVAITWSHNNGLIPNAVDC